MKKKPDQVSVPGAERTARPVHPVGLRRQTEHGVVAVATAAVRRRRRRRPADVRRRNDVVHLRLGAGAQQHPPPAAARCLKNVGDFPAIDVINGPST